MKQTNCLVTLCLLLLALKLYAAEKPIIGKQPSWVSATSVNYTATNLDREAEDGYIDLHFEKQVSLRQQTVFLKKAVHILSEAGVQNQSQISLDYDPSYQSLAFHSIRILRGGEVINKLELSKIKTIQQEKELDRFLYNGSLTAVLILEDVRKGDIIEYSYSIKGFNPIFKNKYATLLQTKFGVPVYSIYYKLIAPKERNMVIKNSLTELQPTVSATATEKVYEWTIGESTAVRTEANIPSWHDAYPMVMISEFSSWKEVSDWASELFPLSVPLSGNLQKKIADIKAKNATPEAQLLAALRFVQDDVRYMGIEMGVNSHKPHSPSQVFSQRFGDCKDKAYLLCAVLKALGIEAYPVLNNTSYKKTIASWQPTPTAFDHATVCVQMNGQSYWFDPTIAYQRGPLSAISYPAYQIGLVIRPGTSGLTTIPLQDDGKISTKEIFTVRQLNGPASLKVVTQFSGSFADNVRYNIQNTSLTEIKKSYKDLYAGYFKNIETDSLVYADDEKTGRFTTIEYYTIKSFWSEENGKTRVLLEPYLINTILKKPKEEERTMPYSLSYPVRYHEEIEVNLPKNWSVEEASDEFKNAAFAFNYRYSQPAADRVLFEYDYENLKDHVAPAETAGFLKGISQAEKSRAYELYSEQETFSATSFSSSSNNGFTAAYVLLGLCAIVTYYYKRHSRSGTDLE
jgi:transglutaminase-like putative cysteine protease